jgi:hypothetical protein
MPIDSHLPQADPFSLVPTFNRSKELKAMLNNRTVSENIPEDQLNIYYIELDGVGIICSLKWP